MTRCHHCPLPTICGVCLSFPCAISLVLGLMAFAIGGAR